MKGDRDCRDFHAEVGAAVLHEGYGANITKETQCDKQCTMWYTHYDKLHEPGRVAQTRLHGHKADVRLRCTSSAFMDHTDKEIHFPKHEDKSTAH